MNVDGSNLKCLNICYDTMYQAGSTCYCRTKSL